jgi:hypothetical protein
LYLGRPLRNRQYEGIHLSGDIERWLPQRERVLKVTVRVYGVYAQFVDVRHSNTQQFKAFTNAVTKAFGCFDSTTYKSAFSQERTIRGVANSVTVNSTRPCSGEGALLSPSQVAPRWEGESYVDADLSVLFSSDRTAWQLLELLGFLASRRRAAPTAAGGFDGLVGGVYGAHKNAAQENEAAEKLADSFYFHFSEEMALLAAIGKVPLEGPHGKQLHQEKEELSNVDSLSPTGVREDMDFSLSLVSMETGSIVPFVVEKGVTTVPVNILLCTSDGTVVASKRIENLTLPAQTKAEDVTFPPYSPRHRKAAMGGAEGMGTLSSCSITAFGQRVTFEAVWAEDTEGASDAEGASVGRRSPTQPVNDSPENVKSHAWGSPRAKAMGKLAKAKAGMMKIITTDDGIVDGTGSSSSGGSSGGGGSGEGGVAMARKIGPKSKTHPHCVWSPDWKGSVYNGAWPNGNWEYAEGTTYTDKYPAGYLAPRPKDDARDSPHTATLEVLLRGSTSGTNSTRFGAGVGGEDDVDGDSEVEYALMEREKCRILSSSLRQVPSVLLVIGGGIDTLDLFREAVDDQRKVILVHKSGNAAQIIELWLRSLADKNVRSTWVDLFDSESKIAEWNRDSADDQLLIRGEPSKNMLKLFTAFPKLAAAAGMGSADGGDSGNDGGDGSGGGGGAHRVVLSRKQWLETTTEQREVRQWFDDVYEVTTKINSRHFTASRPSKIEDDHLYRWVRQNDWLKDTDRWNAAHELTEIFDPTNPEHGTNGHVAFATMVQQSWVTDELLSSEAKLIAAVRNSDYLLAEQILNDGPVYTRGSDPDLDHDLLIFAAYNNFGEVVDVLLKFGFERSRLDALVLLEIKTLLRLAERRQGNSDQSGSSFRTGRAGDGDNDDTGGGAGRRGSAAVDDTNEAFSTAGANGGQGGDEQGSSRGAHGNRDDIHMNDSDSSSYEYTWDDIHAEAPNWKSQQRRENPQCKAPALLVKELLHLRSIEFVDSALLNVPPAVIAEMFTDWLEDGDGGDGSGSKEYGAGGKTSKKTKVVLPDSLLIFWSLLTGRTQVGIVSISMHK